MAAKDAAFMWETEALRSSPISVPPPPGASSGQGRGWLTLRETERVTGIPISTLRKWVRKDAVPSFLQETEEGPIRMVWLRGVTQRAEMLGRDLDDIFEQESLEAEGDELIDLLTDSEPDPDPTSADEPDSSQPVSDPAPGTMVVPIEAWDKMLMQLGNLHEAGQQLADARERAAKAETEAMFLRERLAEIKTDAAHRAPAPEPAAEPESSAPRRVSIEIEDGPDDLGVDEPEPAEVPEVVEEFPSEGVTSLSSYSVAVIKHLYGTWRDRPRR